MPTTLHPQAKFDPIPPDLDLHALVDRAPNFDWVVRISLAQIRRLGPSGFEKLVQLHVIEGGRPLVIEGWNKVLPEDLFSAKWLEKTYDKKQENVRDIGTATDIPMTTGHYLRSMRQLTNQWTPTNFRDERRQRLYLKDIDCPTEWHEYLRKVIPPNVFYMNQNISENNGVDSRNDNIFGASEPTAAVAGDLMSSLPEQMRAQNLMCYVGHEGTYTPAHKEMCASLGQNIMVEASSDQNNEMPGSSIWFMTETKDREVVREYFLSMLGHDIEIEKHFAQINAWKKANFPVYVVEQRVGDFILIPPLAPHQVWNRGTRTMKVAWNRTTVDTLSLALHEALPKARLVCRDEQYKNKAIIFYTLQNYYQELQKVEDEAESSFLGLGRELSSSPRIKELAQDFRRLFEMFTEILIDEMFGYKHIDTEFIEFDSNITCSYCRSNIFNRFLTCKCCVRTLIDGDEDTYDICMECYAMGRSCVCISGLQWCEQWHWADLVEKHETWRAMVVKQDGFVDLDYSPQPLEIARKKAGRKSVAQVCQEQLKRRPWNDITKPADVPPAEPESEPEPEVDDEGRVKKKSKHPKRKKKTGETYRCHVCCHKDYTYKLAHCTTCTEAYCYGVLWRAFDTMPQAVMEQDWWQCPKCLGICNCGYCRRVGNTKPYVPKMTLLGHDTRRVADDRSVEFIVDFRVHNLSWLKAAGEENRSKDSRRMQRLKEHADAEKAKDPLNALEASAEEVPHEMDIALQDSIMQDIHGDRDQPLAPNEPSSTNGQDHAMTDASALQNREEDSIYPDPAMGGRMMGMGFYDQDDSADRILFDAFQIPTADAFNDEPEVSEFVKKTLRMAKRKARLETDDDPDFQGPKSHHRKKPKTGNIDQLVNLDPALLGTLGNGPDSENQTPTRLEGQAKSQSISANDPAVPEKEAQVPKAARNTLPIDPLRPTLRHAKPVQSYVEAEDPTEDPEDLVTPISLPFKPINKVIRPANKEPDPLDLAAEAIRTLTGREPSPEVTVSPLETGKRRGRPPGRPSRSSLPASTPAVPAKTPKRRGRPPRRQSRPQEVAEEDQNDGNQAADGDEDLAAELERELSKPDGEEIAPHSEPHRRRGRPPAARRSMPNPNPSNVPASLEAPPRPLEMLSMAERMALKGKKFKMRAKPKSNDDSPSSPAISSGPSSATRISKDQSSHKSLRQGSTPIVTPVKPPKRGRTELVDEDFQEVEEESVASSPSTVTPEGESQMGTRRRPVTRTAPSGAQIVSIGDEVDDFAESPTEESPSSSESDFDDDDDGGDIPARIPPGTARRGGARGRGRGRGRGGLRMRGR